jgi:hypothetical protein
MKLLFLLFLCCWNVFSQNLLQDNEECVFSFNTKNGKTMLLAKDKSNKYMVYRFGKKDKIELEYPQKDDQSWSQFTYNYYFRGGGKQNAGLDIDNVRFEIDGYTYIIYSSYSAGDDNNDESYSIGINIYDKNDNRIKIVGIPKTEKGNLQGFRTNELIKIDLESGLEE